VAKRQMRVAGRRRKADAAARVSEPHLLRKSVKWVVGLVLAAVATLVTGVLTGIPAQLFDVPAVQDKLRSGPDFSAVADITYLDDEGRSMATRSSEVSEQLLRALAQPMAAVAPEFLELARVAGGVNVEKLTIRVILEGRRNQQIRILGIRPVMVEQTPPLGGMLFNVPPQAGDATMQMIIDFDRPNPVVREILPGSDPLSGPKGGRPFFDNNTISLRDREQQVLLIRAAVTWYYAAFNLQIDYRIGDESRTMQISDHGQPFRVTGLHPGTEPDTLSYERAFTLQSDFSLCPVANPHRITDSGLVCPG
jgi:hypothetical protein